MSEFDDTADTGDERIQSWSLLPGGLQSSPLAGPTGRGITPTSFDLDPQAAPTRCSSYCGAPLAWNQAMLEVFCGLTVPLALMPEAIGFSFVAGVSPGLALTTSWIICFVTSVLGGRPAMVSAAAGSVAVCVTDLVAEEGVEHLFYAAIVMGFLQIILGVIKAGNLARILPDTVIIGFCNGLAILIFSAQLDSFKIPKGMPHAGDWIHGSQLAWSVLLCAIAFFTSVLLPKLTPMVPSALVGIVMAVAVEWTVVRPLGGRVIAISDIASVKAAFPVPVWFDSAYAMPPFSLATLQKVFPVSLTMALVGLVESLLTLSLVDEYTQTRGNIMQECIGQGFANIVSGALGGNGGCAMIGQTMVNLSSGSRTRLSGIVASLFLLCTVLFLYEVIGTIPTAALAGVMFNVCRLTFNWKSLQIIFCTICPSALARRLRIPRLRVRRADVITIVLVTIIPQVFDLGIATVAGSLFQAVAYVKDMEDSITCEVELKQDSAGRVVEKVYKVKGHLFFASKAHFLDLFNVKEDPVNVMARFDEATIGDYSALEAINTLGDRYSALEKSLRVENLNHASSKRFLKRSLGLMHDSVAVTMSLQVSP